MKKTRLFFILVALLVLGYLHLLTIYASRIETSVVVTQQQSKNNQGLESVLAADFKLPQQHQQPISLSAGRPRLSAQETRQRLLRSSEAALPIIQSIHGAGNPIPTDNVTMQQLDLDDPQVRAQRVIYVITPTHRRITQRVDLTRLKQTLQLASITHHALIYWILLEDSDSCSQSVRQLAQDSGLYFAHKAVQNEKHNNPHNKLNKRNPGHRGLVQRNAGLEIVLQVGKEGVIYFADDDNGYDIQLFTELTYTRHASVFAVGLSGGAAYERCHVNEATGKVDAILSTWKPRNLPRVGGASITPRLRKFGIDMAGFALSTTALVTSQARFHQRSLAGWLETDFLSILVKDVSELEPLAANCTIILAWHVKTSEPQWMHNPEPDGDVTFKLIKSML
jgi:Glycosyltransferase family 43